jgi:outer membrane protein, adhesin transport system
LQAVRLRELYEDQFQAALRDVNDLLIVETELLESERQLVDALTERLRAQFQAAAQVGMLHAALEGRPD